MPKLWSLDPGNQTTWERESLWSYICRLAEWNHMVVGDLIRRVIWTDASWRGPENHSMSSAVKLINLGGMYTRFWVDTLEALTGQENLSRLTFLPGMHAIRFEGSLLQIGSVCVECLREMRPSAVYQPLCWSLRDYTICAKHHVCMTRHCSVCGGSNIGRTWTNKRVGCCGNCGAWLGGPSFQSVVSESANRYELAVSEMLKGLMDALNDTRIASLGSGTILKFAAEHYFESQAELCRALNVGKSTVSTLMSEKTRPTVEMLIALSVASDVPMRQLLIGAALNRRARRRHPDIPLVVPAKVQFQRRPAFDVAKIGKRLKSFLVRKHPPSVRQAADMLNVHERGLRAKFPDDCAKLSARHSEWVRSRAKQKEQELKKRLLVAVTTCVLFREFPTSRKVQSVAPGLLAHRSVQRFYAFLMESIGLRGCGRLPPVLRAKRLKVARETLLGLVKNPSQILAA
jgi:transcriptional regulator with XRE-family HTH domain